MLVIVEVTAGVLTDVVTGVCIISSRSGKGRRVTCWPVVRVVAGVEADVQVRVRFSTSVSVKVEGRQE